MSQPPNQDYPGWITAGVAVMGVIGSFVAVAAKRIYSSVTHKEFKEYLRQRDELSEQRHTANLERLDNIRDDVQDSRERLSKIEGRLERRA